MKKVILAVTVLTSMIYTGLAQNIKFDFSNPDISKMKIKRKAKVEKGVLKFANGGAVDFKIAVATPVTISFKVRVTKAFKNTKTSPYWSFGLFGNNTEHGIFMVRENSMLESYLYKNKKKKGGAINKAPFIVNQWFTVEFTILKNLVNVKFDNKDIMNAKYTGLLPLNHFSFSTYGLEWEIDDLNVTILPNDAPKLIKKATFSVDFNDSLEAVNENGKKIQPTSKENYQLTEGIEGKGLTVNAGGKGGVVFPLNKPLSSKVGGLMFWVKANQKQGAQLFKLNQSGDTKLTAALNGDKRIVIAVQRSDNDKHLAYIRTVPGTVEDWFLIALTWNEDGESKYFINANPTLISFTPMQRIPDFLKGDVDNITNLKFSSNRKSTCTIDRLRLFHRPLKNSEIYAEYRRFMPIDMVMERTIVPAGTPTNISVQVAPGGFYMRPIPVAIEKFMPAEVIINFQLKDKDGNIVLTDSKKLDVSEPQDVELKSVVLPMGRYALECSVDYRGGHYKRTFEVNSFTSKYKGIPSRKNLKIGKLLYRKQLNNAHDKELLTQGDVALSPDKSYLEAGINKGDRFSFEIPFAEKQLGKPVVLDITWPDDKLRMMGLYMYPYKIGCNRDRLQSGIQAGNEFPNSGKKITTRHIFYPGTSKYLFEARTMAAGMPAAISEIKVYEIDGDLPMLTIHYPENMPGRKFGHFDEDQTFTNNLNVDMAHPRSPIYNKYKQQYPTPTAFFTEEIMRYFNYVGMNTMHYPVWRYNVGFIPVEGHTNNGLYPGKIGELSYVFDQFAANDKKFIAMLNYGNVPDIRWLKVIESNYRKEGMVSLDRFGDNIKLYNKGPQQANICHPKVLKLFASYFEEPVKRYSKASGFDGINYWISNFGNWMSLEYGYDDYTVNKFSRETGVKVPEKLGDRYKYLTTEKRKDWLKWRSEQVTNVIKMIRSVLNKYNPELKLFLGINQNPDNYEKHGFDLEAIKKIPNVHISAIRQPMAYRHAMHWGKPESTQNEELYDYKNKDIKNYLTDGSAAVVISDHSYFETFVHPLSKEYSCYFENADVKPHSRFFLRELAFAVGAFDTQEYVLGAQPLGTIGRDEEAREFAQAFCALPARNFSLVSGINDPVLARFLHTENGTYFYVVNMFHGDVRVKLDFEKKGFFSLFNKAISYMDLSTDKMSNSNVINLKPFQLRSFLFPKEKVAITGIKFSGVQREIPELYQQRIATLKAAADILKQEKIDIVAEDSDIKQLEKLLAENQYAELYRLAFSKRMNQLLKKKDNLANIILKQQMIDRGHYAVNCGASTFYKAPNGKVFFPDQKFDGKYGYFGRDYKSVGREIAKVLKGTDIPELFKTEAYDLEGYKFKVPNGTYKIRFYLKVGFKPGFVPDIFHFSILTNGKPIVDKIDLYKATGEDFNKVVVIETENVEVKNGELVLTWLYESPRHPKATMTARLANAIEVIKQ